MVKTEYPIRVLHRGMSNNKGGIEAFIMNLYRNIDRTKVQFDFIVPENMTIAYEEEILELGGHIYKVICGMKRNPIRGLFCYQKFFREHPEISVLHVHDCSAANLRIMKIAKRMGIKNRILHSHNNDYLTKLNIRQLMVEKLNKKRLNKIATYLCACSEEAGKFMFGDCAFNVVNNAVEPENFLFDVEKRNKIRRELNIDKDVVVGCVARFQEQKNHQFLLDVFCEYKKIVPNAKLLLIGDGELRTDICNKARNLKIEQDILMLGVRSDVSDLFNCMDVFVLPSLSEGLGIVFIEAQINGLPCLASDRVPAESNILAGIRYRALHDSPKEWAQTLFELSSSKSREVDLRLVQEKGYDIVHESKKVQDIYLNMIQ